MDAIEIERYILTELQNVEISENFGYKFFFFGDDHRLPFATIALSDNEYESISKLDREGVFRLNIGVAKQTFQSLFGAEEVSLETYDFTELNRWMPHPDYARQFFICILNPTGPNLATMREFLTEAHGIAERRYRVNSKEA
jgi:hypothetical protein